MERARSAYTAGRLDDARHACQECLATDSTCAEALSLLGHTYVAEQRFTEAVLWFSRSAAVKPDNAETLGNLGAVLLASGRAREAADVLERVARSASADASLHYNLGRAQEQVGDEAAAIASHQRATAIDPTFVASHRELGFLFEKAGRLAEALNAFETALRLRGSDGSLHYNRGVVLLGLQRFEEAEGALAKAIALGRETASTHNNLGLTFHRRGRLSEAGAHFRRALQLDSRLASAWLNLGNVLMQEPGDVREAMRHFARAIENDPTDATAQLNQALCCLLCGDFARGWQLFGSRLLLGAQRLGMHVPENVPLWDGRSRGPSTAEIIVVAEQGFGDVIQFARFGEVLASQGFRPILQCPPRLLRLLSSAKGFVDIVPDGTRYTPGRHVWFPMMSVPAALGTDLHSIPSSAAYLSADVDRVAEWRARLGDAGRYRIGIAWQGNLEHEQESLRGRSIPLEAFGPLLEVPDITWISLQKGPGSEQLASVPWRDRVRSYEGQLDCGPDAFQDTAAIMANLDLVITCDTSVAHLAGALGCRTWVALTRTPDWRWLLDRADSPWYPSSRLFRQKQPRDWRPVFQEMRADLPAALGLHV